MYYLLKLETIYTIDVGTRIVKEPENINKPITLHLIKDYIFANPYGLFWNGKKVFTEIAEEYEDVVTDEIHNIDFTVFCENDLAVRDELYDAIEDLLEDDLIPQWEDMKKPIIFLMVIKDYRTWTDYGYEYDVEHYSVKVIADADFEKLL